MNDAVRLIVSILMCQAAGFFGGLVMGDGVTSWYPTIRKPPWTPPGSVIGLVWVSLFTLMGIALFLVWRAAAAAGAAEASGLPRPPRSDASSFRLAISLFALQWVLNVGWNYAFFGLGSPLAGLVEIVVLLMAIAGTMVAFWRISMWAGVLFAPYLGWVGFAAYLTFAIWRLNR